MKEIKQNSAYAWLLAARPKTLTGAAIPVAVSAALAASDGKFQWLPALLCLAFACLMQVAANFINDLYDFLKGTDRADRLGPERACSQGWISAGAMRAGIAVVVSLACFLGLGLLFYGSLWLIALGAGCVLFAFLYTLFLSYWGLGDLLVVVFFGFVPVLGTYYVQTGEITASAWVCALSCGIVIDLLLIVNNYRDRDQDKLSGKKTLIARWGESFGRRQYLLTGFAAWACTLALLAGGRTWAFVLPTLFLPLHLSVWRQMAAINHGRALNRVLGLTSRNMLLFGLLLGAGLLLG